MNNKFKALFILSIIINFIVIIILLINTTKNNNQNCFDSVNKEFKSMSDYYLNNFNTSNFPDSLFNIQLNVKSNITFFSRISKYFFLDYEAYSNEPLNEYLNNNKTKNTDKNAKVIIRRVPPFMYHYYKGYYSADNDFLIEKEYKNYPFSNSNPYTFNLILCLRQFKTNGNFGCFYILWNRITNEVPFYINNKYIKEIYTNLPNEYVFHLFPFYKGKIINKIPFEIVAEPKREEDFKTALDKIEIHWNKNNTEIPYMGEQIIWKTLDSCLWKK